MEIIGISPLQLKTKRSLEHLLGIRRNHIILPSETDTGNIMNKWARKHGYQMLLHAVGIIKCIVWMYKMYINEMLFLNLLLFLKFYYIVYFRYKRRRYILYNICGRVCVVILMAETRIHFTLFTIMHEITRSLP